VIVGRFKGLYEKNRNIATFIVNRILWWYCCDLDQYVRDRVEKIAQEKTA